MVCSTSLMMKLVLGSSVFLALVAVIAAGSGPFFDYNSYLLLGASTKAADLPATSHDVSIVEGPNGLKAWQFQGQADSYVQITNNGTLNLAGKSWTIGTFFYQEGSIKHGPILEWRGRGPFGTHFWIWGGGLFTNLDPYSGKSAMSLSKAPTVNAWHFVGVSYNAETGAFFMWDNDEVFVEKKNIGALKDLDQTGDVYIGIRPGQPSFNPLKAKLAGMTILDGAIEPSNITSFKDQIIEHARPFFGYESYVLLGESTTDADLPATSHGVSMVEGPNGLKAWQFEGKSDSYVQITNNGTLNLAGKGWTIGTFFYQEGSIKHGPILEWRGRGPFGTHFWIWGGGLFTNLDPYSGKSAMSLSKAPTVNAWHFVGVSYNAETGAFFMWDNDEVFVEKKNIGALKDLDQTGDVYIGIRPGQPSFNPLKAKLAGMTLLAGAIEPSKIASFKDQIIKRK